MNPEEVRGYLLKRDRRLEKWLPIPMECPFFSKPKISQARLLDCLTDIVISQQLSNNTAKKIGRKLKVNASSRVALEEKIMGLENIEGKREGLSGQKIKYLKGIVGALRSGQLSMKKLHGKTDEEIVTLLCQLQGMGRWSAEMFLMFGLHRMDVFSLSDYGLVQGTKKLYGSTQLSTEQLRKISSKWKPYRSVVSWHLWIGHDR